MTHIPGPWNVEEHEQIKTCADCEKDLFQPIDEYGDVHFPVCQRCFFDAIQTGVLKNIQSLEIELQKLTDEASDVEDELEELEEEISSTENKIRDLKSGNSDKNKSTEVEKKLNDWVHGKAMGAA